MKAENRCPIRCSLLFTLVGGALIPAVACASTVSVPTGMATPIANAPGPYANETDRASSAMFAKREADWRNGAVVYQVLVDRFAPSDHLQDKRALYPAPKILRRWDELPQRGTYLPAARLWSHEIDFWGGDLPSVKSRLDYIDALGADVLYLNPIHLAYTNHKYDALDYLAISPEFGTRADLDALIKDVHARGMKLVLDGVFNHMGRNSATFQAALKDTASPYRGWFNWGPQYPGGVRIWVDAENLPELNLENRKVRDYIYATPASVVQSYLREGIDGWRLDVAYDIGFAYLGELTRAAHAAKPGSLVVGELANYPREWFPSVDGVMDFTLRQVIIGVANHDIPADVGIGMIERVLATAGTEPMLKSWLFLDNHDTQRIGTMLQDSKQRRLAQVLQFTLPGAPNLYYGSELGMTGGEDPLMRAPMRWDMATAANPTFAWTRQLVALHQGHRALRIGDFRRLDCAKLLAFERYTDRVADAVIVLANPGVTAVSEPVLVPDSKLMNGGSLVDLLDAGAPPVRIDSAMIRVTLPAGSMRVLAPYTLPKKGYTPYKRVQ